MNSNIEKYRETINEARRFIKKTEVAIERIKIDKYAIYRCSEIAAAKRASMDLTRALAQFRRPW